MPRWGLFFCNVVKLRNHPARLYVLSVTMTLAQRAREWSDPARGAAGEDGEGGRYLSSERRAEASRLRVL